ncbi:MAG: hypothetical protein KGM16_06685 [Bacteroidota bacterium]|nr:hypothetical protein [Bacteroidota bacterium]
MAASDETIVMKAVAICFKPYLKPEEAQIYCNLGRTQLAKRCDEFLIFKNESGYYKREDLDRMMSGGPSPLPEVAKRHSSRFKK